MPQETYRCDICNSSFTNKDELADHMVTNHSTKTVEIEEGETK